jgi:hypothetical protein
MSRSYIIKLTGCRSEGRDVSGTLIHVEEIRS